MFSYPEGYENIITSIDIFYGYRVEEEFFYSEEFADVFHICTGQGSPKTMLSVYNIVRKEVERIYAKTKFVYIHTVASDQRRHIVYKDLLLRYSKKVPQREIFLKSLLEGQENFFVMK